MSNPAATKKARPSTFLATGLAGATIDVKLRVDEVVVDQQQVHATDVRELIRVDFSHVPDEVGLRRVTLRAKAAAMAGEQGEAELSQFVRVSDDTIPVA